MPQVVVWAKSVAMGLRMDDIHTPTVKSGPNSGSASARITEDAKKPLSELIAEKAGLEEELRALSGVLDSVCIFYPSSQDIQADFCCVLKHGVNMTTSLTTFDGYPRDDIDIAQSLRPCPLPMTHCLWYCSKNYTGTNNKTAERLQSFDV